MSSSIRFVPSKQKVSSRASSSTPAHHKRKSTKSSTQAVVAPALVPMAALLLTETPSTSGPILFANLSLNIEGGSFDTIDGCLFKDERSNSVDWDDTLYDEIK